MILLGGKATTLKRVHHVSKRGCVSDTHGEILKELVSVRMKVTVGEVILGEKCFLENIFAESHQIHPAHNHYIISLVQIDKKLNQKIY